MLSLLRGLTKNSKADHVLRQPILFPSVESQTLCDEGPEWGPLLGEEQTAIKR